MIVFHTIPKFDVYISDEFTGHKVSFLIISENQCFIETYNLQMKMINPFVKKEVIRLDNLSTDLFFISDSLIEYNNIRFLSSKTIEKTGDFHYLNNRFGVLSNKERLNVCRNSFFLYHPSKKFSIGLKQYPKKGLKILEEINSTSEHSVFLDELQKLVLKE